MRWPVLEVGGVRLAPRQVRHSTTGRRQNECSNGSKTGQCVGKDALAEKNMQDDADMLSGEESWSVRGWEKGFGAEERSWIGRAA
jgi:hypothetical protein